MGLLAVVVGVLGLPAPFGQAITAADAITYVYDDLGRLEAVIDPGQTNGLARYTYDGAGNLLSIARQSSTATTIVDLHPKSAKRDGKVTIYGSGFSSTPGSNTVKFAGSSGTTTTVVSATTTQLVVEIPDSGTIDGAIYVQAPGGSATSTQQFAEDTSGPPTITSFTPTVAATGATVTITGTKFDPVPARNNVFINAVRAEVTAATSTSLSIAVPPFLTSGKISVQTPDGQVTSTADFSSPPLSDATTPAPYIASQIDSIQRLTLGTPASVAVTVAGHASMALVDSAEEARIFVDSSTFSGGQARVKLFDPYGRLLSSTIVSSTQTGYLDTTPTYSAGTYVVLVDPVSASVTGSLTLTVSDVSTDVSGQITTDGSGVSTGSLTLGQGAHYTFTGTANQRVSLLTKNSTIGTGIVNLRHPDTWLVDDLVFNATGPNDFMEPVTLPSAGTYSLQVDPVGRRTGTVTLELYDVPADPTPSMTIGGSSVTVDLLTPGQNAYPTFSGTSGQDIRLTLSNVSITNSTVKIKNPAGSVIASGSFGTSGGTLDASLTTTGTHSIEVNPGAERTGSMTLALTLQGGMAPIFLHDPGVPETSPAQSEPEVLELLDGFEPAGIEQWIPDKGRLNQWTTERPPSPFSSLPPLVSEGRKAALSGQVLRLDGRPIPGVPVSVGRVSSVTEEGGRFLLEGVRPGNHRVLEVDGSAAVPGTDYGYYEISIDIDPHRTNFLGDVIWLSMLDEANATPTSWPATSELVITTPEIPGLELHIPEGATVVDRDGEPVDELSITPIPLDRAPFPLPAGVQVPAYYTIQPGGATVQNGLARVVYPNYQNLDPGAKADLWIYEPDEEGWETYGRGTVSADGTQIVPYPGAGIYEFWGVMLGGSYGGGHVDPGGTPGGDPVDLGTGLFDYRKTDLHLPGPMPISLTRIYRQGDTNNYEFGLGTTTQYEAFLDPPVPLYQQADMIMAGARRVHFDRVSPGTSFNNAVMRASPMPGPYYGSLLAYSGGRWNLTRPDGSTLVFNDVYSDLLEIRDRFANRVLVLGPNGLNPNPVTQIVSYPSGRWISLSLTSNKVTSAKDNLGRTVNYTYETGSRLKTVTDANQVGQPSPKATTYTWTTVTGCDPTKVITGITDPRNITWMTNTYGTGCRVTQQTVPTSTGTETWDYAYTVDGSGRVTQTDVTDPNEVIRRVTFDTDGYLLTDTAALGTSSARTFTYTRGSDHLSSAIVDSFHSRRTEFTYTSLGEVLSETRLAGTAQAVTTEYAYEPKFHQLTSITNPLDHAITLEYDTAGCLDEMTDGAGRTTTFDCNSAGLANLVTDPLSHTTYFSYSRGDLVSITDALGRVWTRFVDGGGRVLEGTTPLRETTTYSFDKLNQLIQTTDPLGGEIGFVFDDNGNLKQVNDTRRGSLSQIQFEYNNMNRPSSRTDALGRSESFVYDDMGNPTFATDRKNQVTEFRYDPINRLTFAGYKRTGNPPSFESELSYTFDVGGRLTQIADTTTGVGTITRGYDDLDRLTSEGGITYEYDDASRRTSMSLSGQPQVTYGYNDANQLTSVTKSAASVSLGYDQAGRVQTVSFPTSPQFVQTYGYDNADQVTGITYQRGSDPADDLSYIYDGAGLRTSVYGSLARTDLPVATTATAAYDASNQLTSWEGQTVNHDNNGNLSAEGGMAFSYNARNQLISVTQGQTTLASFLYDGLGRRIEKVLSGTTTRFVYDGWNLLQEKDGGNAVIANILSGSALDQVFSRTPVGGQPSYILTDALGSSIGLADPTGAVTTSYSYEPYGKTTESGAANDNSTRFAGREEDSAGLLDIYHLRGRYYSPELHRFLTEDPFGLAGGDANLYGYVGQKPTMQRDPLGLFEWPPIGPTGFGWMTHGGPSGAAEWAMDRGSEAVEALSDWWSCVVKDMNYLGNALHESLRQALCSGLGGRVLDFFSWAPPSSPGETITKVTTSGGVLVVRILDWMGRQLGLPQNAAAKVLSKAWFPLNAVSTGLDLYLCR